MTKIILEKIKFINQIPINESIIQDLSGAEWYSHVEFMKHELILGIRGYIWGKHKTLDTARWPRDWWESFKERWFPKLLLKKFPVIYTEKTYDAYAIFPNLKLEMPGQHAIMYLQSTTDTGGETPNLTI